MYRHSKYRNDLHVRLNGPQIQCGFEYNVYIDLFTVIYVSLDFFFMWF